MTRTGCRLAHPSLDSANDSVPMKAYGSNPLGRRLTSLKQKLQHIAADPSVDAERRTMYIGYYDAIIRYLLDRIDRMEAALRCAAGSA